MIKSNPACSTVPTNADRRWAYEQYYLGEKDQENRRNGHGQNHWSGAESLEWCTGRFLRDTMHGKGDYRWRYMSSVNTSVTYEGQFYGNDMHGYGIMSYPDGRVFNGLFYKNVRWGPGVESHACVQEDVGLWRGPQLIRLAWRPQTPSITLDLNTGPSAKTCTEPHRVLMAARVKVIGEVNSAIELLKQSGASPLAASEKWTKLYPKNCTDHASQLCHVDVFDYEYYRKKMHVLEEVDSMPEQKEGTSLGTNSDEEYLSPKIYYAWNNSEKIKDIMKHCYKHEKQMSSIGLELKSILSGPRSHFKKPGAHELNCRTMIMASYLGHITDVAQLINESNVHPDVADNQGNSSLMYATCGDQPDIIHFLVEAGADVNGYNDSCCTPLGVMLMKYLCAKRDISANNMVLALVPPPLGLPARTGSPPTIQLEGKPSEWQIMRDQPIQQVVSAVHKNTIKDASKALSVKKIKTSHSDIIATKPSESVNDVTDAAVTEEKQLYKNINAEFSIKVSDVFSTQHSDTSPSYLFVFNDMVKEIIASEEDLKKPPEKGPKKAISKVIKDPVKPSREAMWQSSEKDIGSMSSADRIKIEELQRNLITILQLLHDGADPSLVHCPQPAMLMATLSESPDLVRNLVQYGANVNEMNPHIYNYTALDVAISQPLSYENLELIRILLEFGARTDHTLAYEGIRSTHSSDTSLPEIQGPTLLHAVIAKKTEDNYEEEIRRQLLELLLEYNCNPISQFRGSSALDASMKNMDHLDIFIKNRRTNLNAIINDCNQTVLVKMFSMPFCKSIPITERLQMITSLLLYGADPLLKCQDGQDKFANFFVFAKKVISENEIVKPSSPVSSGKDSKAKKPDNKSKKEDTKIQTKSVGRLANDDIGDYKQALDLVTECARILHVRWLQTKIFKDLIQVIVQYEHRQWNMIVPEHKNKKACGLWLTCTRSLEIWNILKAKKKNKFSDRRILKHVLCIVQFYANRSKISFKPRIEAREKDLIETDVNFILREHKITSDMGQVPLSGQYVTPELFVNAEEKFNICFECSLPLCKKKIECNLCKLVSFCSLQCMEINIDRFGCHPCSDYLKAKYFPSPEGSASDIH